MRKLVIGVSIFGFSSIAIAQDRVWTYAETWGSAPPTQYLVQGQRMLVSGDAQINYEPEWVIDSMCQTNSSVPAACTTFMGDLCFVWIDERVPAEARRNNEEHELAHCGGWPSDHPGAMKPVGHLDACLESMEIGHLTFNRMASLCMLNAGAPLTPEDQIRWNEIRRN